jgi:hypothetical protein
LPGNFFSLILQNQAIRLKAGHSDIYHNDLKSAQTGGNYEENHRVYFSGMDVERILRIS